MLAMQKGSFSHGTSCFMILFSCNLCLHCMLLISCTRSETELARVFFIRQYCFLTSVLMLLCWMLK